MRNFFVKGAAFFVFIIFTSSAAMAGDREEIKKLVLSFYMVDTTTYLFCRSASTGASYNKDQIEMEKAYQQYFSKKLAALYAAINCDPKIDGLRYDPRYGDWEDAIFEPRKITNLKIQKLSIVATQATVRAIYDYDRPGTYARDITYKDYGNFNNYSLIKDDGVWRIDDMQIGGGKARENMDFIVYNSLRKELLKIQAKATNIRKN